MDALIDLIRLRAADPQRATDCAEDVGPQVAPPATSRDVAIAEQAIDHPLPTFLARLYRDVGDGGFGPDYGLLGIAGGARDDQGNDAVAAYRSLRRPDPDDAHWDWPRSLLPIIHGGCGMYLCVDCSTPSGEMVWFEPNSHEEEAPWDTSFIPLTCDIRGLFAAWVEGQNWMDEFVPSEDPA